mmetsp:Transcript_33300/g.61358  ORF Transcript_33300/g.61358 Transcript_33300/m.61358 type:complete len:115 (-) Transcript_33300:159-503(-)
MTSSGTGCGLEVTFLDGVCVDYLVIFDQSSLHFVGPRRTSVTPAEEVCPSVLPIMFCSFSVPLQVLLPVHIYVVNVSFLILWWALSQRTATLTEIELICDDYESDKKMIASATR